MTKQASEKITEIRDRTFRVTPAWDRYNFYLTAVQMGLGLNDAEEIDELLTQKFPSPLTGSRAAGCRCGQEACRE